MWAAAQDSESGTEPCSRLVPAGRPHAPSLTGWVPPAGVAAQCWGCAVRDERGDFQACSKCVALMHQPSVFCSEACLRSAWPRHKRWHKECDFLLSAAIAGDGDDAAGSINGSAVATRASPSSPSMALQRSTKLQDNTPQRAARQDDDAAVGIPGGQRKVGGHGRTAKGAAAVAAEYSERLACADAAQKARERTLLSQALQALASQLKTDNPGHATLDAGRDQFLQPSCLLKQIQKSNSHVKARGSPELWLAVRTQEEPTRSLPGCRQLSATQHTFPMVGFQHPGWWLRSATCSR